MLRLPFYGTQGKFTWRMLATTLGGQAVCVFLGALVARGIAAAGDHPERAGTYLLVGSLLALVCFVGAGLVRRPWGVTLGWLIQVATILSGFVVREMFVIGGIFLLLWIVCLVQGTKIDSRPAPEPDAA